MSTLPREVSFKPAEGKKGEKESIMHKTSTDFKENVKIMPASCARVQTQTQNTKILKSQSPLLSIGLVPIFK